MAEVGALHGRARDLDVRRDRRRPGRERTRKAHRRREAGERLRHWIARRCAPHPRRSRAPRHVAVTRRVVVTGMGAVTPLGLDVALTWDALTNGKSGIGRITRFDPSPYETQIAGELKGFEASAYRSQAIGEGGDIIRRGEADVMVVGGSEAAVLELGIAAFSSMHATSRRNDAPEAASRPFDKDRDGFVLSEGAAVVVLEERDHA